MLLRVVRGGWGRFGLGAPLVPRAMSLAQGARSAWLLPTPGAQLDGPGQCLNPPSRHSSLSRRMHQI